MFILKKTNFSKMRRIVCCGCRFLFIPLYHVKLKTLCNMKKIVKHFGYYSSAVRFIRNYEKKHGKNENHVFSINQLDEGCYEVENHDISKKKKK